MKQATNVFQLARIIFLLTALAGLLSGGCARPHLQADLPEIKPAGTSAHTQPLVVTTPHYRIETLGDSVTAESVGALLETVYQSCSDQLGAGSGHGPFNVYLFNSREAYEQRLAELNLPAQYTSGIFTPGNPGGIYLPLVETSDTHPFFTLAHEAVHQYLHEIKGLPIDGFGGKLPATPLWLSEGLALSMEAALVSTSQLQPGRTHTPRLQHLQGLLESGKAPAVRDVIGRRYGEPFSNADYSVAWGLVDYLQANGLWDAFWAAWEVSVKNGQEEFNREQAEQVAGDLMAMQLAWAEQLGDLSEQVFDLRVVGPQGWPNFQSRWQKSILQLTSTR